MNVNVKKNLSLLALFANYLLLGNTYTEIINSLTYSKLHYSEAWVHAKNSSAMNIIWLSNLGLVHPLVLPFNDL